MAVIETVGLTEQYPAVTALDHLDVSLGDGVTGMVGAHGAGKATLIKLLLGLVPPPTGPATRAGVRPDGGRPARETAAVRR